LTIFVFSDGGQRIVETAASAVGADTLRPDPSEFPQLSRPLGVKGG
jgi:hypothetical protein